MQGLVVGHIQSGKTANFSALIAKAADAGYKLVIVLSGVHNSLRQQTQKRLERELGLTAAGVGLAEPGRKWVAFTSSTLNGDFQPGSANAAVLQGNEHVLLVVKKYASVLRRLSGWMTGNVPDSLPVLIIDDEADQASINTGGNRPPIEEVTDVAPGDIEGSNQTDELDPSVINGLIRSLISQFKRVSYVAYTATPFANVLINHEATDREVLEDLYPRDFIMSLPRPHGYVGADRLFGRDALPGEAAGVEGLDVIELVPESEAETLTPTSPQNPDDFRPELPASLKTAVLDYVLATAGRARRNGNLDFAASMLVHVHHRIFVQDRVGELLNTYVEALRQQWRYDNDALRPVLLKRWESRFRSVTKDVRPEHDVPFEQIVPFLDQFLRDPINVLILNSRSQDVLDYEATPNLKAILVGGNRLSRGLTLEGLLVSYFIRSALYFDTLLQMGRWFGYRGEYVDLTRLYTTENLAGLFRDVALAEEDLRRDIARYEREGLTPLDFGPRIRTHPAMLVTAPAKMGSGQVRAVNFSGALVQTTVFRLDEAAWLERNLTATKKFLSSIGAPVQIDRGRFIWSGIPWQKVNEFLTAYQTDPRNARLDARHLREYIERQAQVGELVRWWVGVVGQSHATILGDEDLGISGHPNVHTIARAQIRNQPGSIGVLVNPATQASAPGTGDEEIGLSDFQQAQARTSVADTVKFGEALRAHRDKTEGLLLIYPISKHSQPRESSKERIPLFESPDTSGRTVIGVALVFPTSVSRATIEYVEGSVNKL